MKAPSGGTMVSSIVVLLVGVAIAALVIFGILKGIKLLLLIAALLALGFVGYLYLGGKASSLTNPTIFKGPIIIKIEPNKSSMTVDPRVELAPETKKQLGELFGSAD